MRLDQFFCIDCGALLSAEVSQFPARWVCLRGDREPVPHGFWCFDEEQRRYVLHPADRRELVAKGKTLGCCGGIIGQVGCRKGHAVGRMGVDCRECWLHWDERRVVRVAEAGSTRWCAYFGEDVCKSDWAVASELHRALAASDWFGTDWRALARACGSQRRRETILVWLQSSESLLAGVDVESITVELAGANIDLVLR